MSTFTNKNYIDAREEYVEAIKKEMLGPGSEISIPDEEHELISESPVSRYSLGVLFPQDEKTEADNDSVLEKTEDETDPDLLSLESEEENGSANSKDNSRDDSVTDSSDDDDDNLEEEVSLASQNKPSSLGIIFFVRGNTDHIVCHLDFGTYRTALMSELAVPVSEEDIENFRLPDETLDYVKYDSEKHLLKVNTENQLKMKLTGKILRDMKERDVFSEYSFCVYNALFTLAKQIKNSYVRVPHHVIEDVAFDGNHYESGKGIAGTPLKIIGMRRDLGGNLWAVTLMLVNSEISANDSKNAMKCIFQPKITINTDDNDFCFVDYTKTNSRKSLSKEDLSLEMQYRNKKNFASGLGTAADWDVDNNGLGKIYNNLFPKYEVPQMDFNIDTKKYDVDPNAFRMKYLSDLTDESIETKIDCLQGIVNAYGQWIEEQKAKQNQFSELSDEDQYKSAADANIKGCTDSYKRMLSGLSTLKSNKLAWKAFELANRAMYMQRVHVNLPNYLEGMSENDKGDFLAEIDYMTVDQDVKDWYAWRPFQIAFLIMSINSIVEDSNPDRALVDLIWFPTGGGKTEAYLGLTAFTIFYRRLRYPGASGGTTVMMRYTLRLLTAQQFTRAATLICACENIRLDATSRRPTVRKYPLGEEPITIGLWIGGSHTPNKIQTAKDCIEKLHDVRRVESLRYTSAAYNKFQVLKCPWCGKSMVRENVNGQLKGSWGYVNSHGHILLKCSQDGCFFNEEGQLPIQVVDEELYNNPPTLLFGTVDKFAMLTWNAKAGAFFGVDSKNRAPELVIQDELHLISGPLGTMVGLYETAIEVICEQQGNKPKVIASTATIRGAVEQCSALYDRKVVQFPHPCLDAEDTFFAKEMQIDHDNGEFGRLYVGLLPSGKTKAMAEDRIIAALMQRIKILDVPEEIKDKYWTLVVYFNSLKELGKCSTLIRDEVREFITRTAQRLGLKKDARWVESIDELTSHVGTTDLNETLDKLEKNHYKKQPKPEDKTPSDIVLATNMISVGIDIDRLNVMLMAGQPKLTSEYIQASSRVSRRYPGVVFVQYDGSRSRDRSHYEQFRPYHSSFYKYVEPTGVTPFSKPARERALHSVLIAILRNCDKDLQNESDAGKFRRMNENALISKIKKAIIQRANNINSRLPYKVEDESEQIDSEMEQFLQRWDNWSAELGSDLVYGEKALVKSLPDTQRRVIAPYGTRNDDYLATAMTSMRNVDAQLRAEVVSWEDDYNEN